ncbi:MAG: type IV pilus biogenesis protein PilM [Planctomycetaceae bacterium]
MSRFLSIDWTAGELRFVAATARRSSLVIEHAGSVSLEVVPETPSEESSEPSASPAPAAGTPSLIPDSLAARLQEAVAAHRSGRPVILVGLDRSQVESLEMTLPPASDRELPEMVINQAMRESPAITEDSVLDFLPLTESADEQRFVTAVAIAPDRLAAIKAACESAGIAPQRILFRPFASSSLFLNNADDRTASRLLVNLVDRTADLTVVAGGKLVLTRSVRLPAGDAASGAKRLAAEVRRTIMLAPHERLAGEEVSGIVVFGRAEEHQELLDVLRAETSLAASAFDPFAATGNSGVAIPEESGRFASLIGMLADEASRRSPAIDFLNPRKPPKVPSRRRSLVTAGAAVGLALVAALWFVYSDLDAVAAANSELERELKDLDAEFKKLDKTRQLAGAIDEWESGNINWLDELKDFSVRFPPSRDAVVLRMSMSPSRGGGGVVTLQGQARNPAVVETLGQSIRDGSHEIQTPRVQERLQEKSYTWQFETSIFVAAKKEDDVPEDRKTAAVERTTRKPAAEPTTATSAKADSEVAP